MLISQNQIFPLFLSHSQYYARYFIKASTTIKIKKNVKTDSSCSREENVTRAKKFNNN